VSGGGKMIRLSRMVVFGVLAIACAGGLLAQDKKKNKEDAGARSVQGSVVDPEDKPVAGAVVQLKDIRTLQVRSFITQADGSYHFSGLKVDNDYQLKADYNNMSSGSKTLSVFDTRKLAIVNLKLEKK